ncbi:PREDICTED: uncharacterized protein LOC105313995 [Amphimedon queenslandica]|uniref:ZMYM2-like/QRICH1 C-terminal domain-containing protein n=1 Tax=Amphimedon queenslandica TaxID=400682 RepID=A0AAN0IP83_AMPQE|nr:PREDICTED: uncharacterized protein LOC105313995 [Amphimedon queenslandica]|eukprot:XP_011406166.1 PREDICTED: uncharacterized protein LOC105313995 [Amphimedon queenslandica]
MRDKDFLLINLLPPNLNNCTSISPSCFGPLVTDADILEKIEGHIPPSKGKATSWAVKVLNDWRHSRMGAIKPTEFYVVTKSLLNYWLSRFVVAARNTQGKPFTGVSLMVCVLESNDTAFDCVLKELHKEGIGTIKKQAAIISTDLEERMWNDMLLGDSNPHLLLNMTVHCLGLNLALRSGREHRLLCPDTIQLQEPKMLDGSFCTVKAGLKTMLEGSRNVR